MGISGNNAYKTGEKEFQLLLAAGLIRKFETISEDDVYEKALRCFEGLLDIRDSVDTAGHISAMIDRQATAVQKCAEAIIDRLLFNKRNDPYISMGLTGHVGKDEVNRRWKRLIVLYHPDKYPNQMEYEEKTKKLNEAYEQIRNKKETANPRKASDNVYRATLPKAAAVHYAGFLKYLPFFILAMAVFMAIVSVLIFYAY